MKLRKAKLKNLVYLVLLIGTIKMIRMTMWFFRKRWPIIINLGIISMM